MKLFLSIILSLVFILPARAQTLKNALLIPYRDGEKWGYSDTLGKMVITPQFDSAGFITVHQKIVFGVVCQNNKKGLILPDGQMLLPVQYDQIGDQCFDNAFIVDVNGKKGIVNTENEVVLPIKYDKLEFYKEWYIRTYQNNKKGLFLINTFYPPIKPLYEEIEPQTSISVNGNWSFAVFKVQKKGKTGYVGENGVEFFRN